jgi:predicted nucleotidyltransferase
MGGPDGVGESVGLGFGSGQGAAMITTSPVVLPLELRGRDPPTSQGGTHRTASRSLARPGPFWYHILMISDIKAGRETPSGRFLLRLGPELHGRLRAEAAEAGLSLNEYCARKLALPWPPPSDPAGAVLASSRAVLGEALVGVVAFGSWARGEAMTGSDVDVLLVVEPGTRVTRGIYREWEAASPGWGGRRVDAHVVVLPSSAARVSGLWAEAALDGMVLGDRGHRIGRYLGAIRRRIAAGELERGEAHGQPYWREVA